MPIKVVNIATLFGLGRNFSHRIGFKNPIVDNQTGMAVSEFGESE
jgi:hypothetical protein